MKDKDLILLSLIVLIILILFMSNYNNCKCNDVEENFDKKCYDTQIACINDCVPVYTFTPNNNNKWIFYNGSVDDSMPPTLTFTRYPNNVIEVSSSSVNTANRCKGDGWLYFSLTDGIWRDGSTTLSTPPSFINSLVSEKGTIQPSTRATTKVTSEFPIIINHNVKEICAAGIGSFTADNNNAGIASPSSDKCCPSLFFYIVPFSKVWLGAGSGTNFTIPPFVGRYQSGA